MRNIVEETTEYKMPEMVEIDEAIEQLNNAIAELTEAVKKVEDDNGNRDEGSSMKTYNITTTFIVEVEAEDEDEAFQKVNRDNDYGDVVDQNITAEKFVDIWEKEVA
tara:strand:+ start:595 stop:915 length:321 start_codon:yes stop_codon:yes gene_type:complete